MDTCYEMMAPRTSRLGSRQTRGGFWRRAAATLREWREVARTRRELAQLSDRELHDIGITYAEAQFESAMPFWRTERRSDRD